MGIKTIHGKLSWPGLANPSCSPQPLDAPGLPTATARGWGQKTFPPDSPKPLPWRVVGEQRGCGQEWWRSCQPTLRKEEHLLPSPFGKQEGGPEVQLGRVGPGPGGGGMGAGLSEWGSLGSMGSMPT